MFDVIIIGAGPSGLSVAIEAKKRGLSYLVIEKGGIVNAIQHFPQSRTESAAGFVLAIVLGIVGAAALVHWWAM